MVCGEKEDEEGMSEMKKPPGADLLEVREK